MRKIYDAIKFADRHHKGQFRKATGVPYITHPIAVSYLLAQYKVSKNLEDLIVACILHDLLEDTAVTMVQIARKFGPLVASLCQELKNDPEQIAKLGKLVDRLHNILDHPTKKMVADTLALMSHLRKGRKLTKTQKRIVADIEAACLARQQAEREAT